MIEAMLARSARGALVAALLVLSHGRSDADPAALEAACAAGNGHACLDRSAFAKTMPEEAQFQQKGCKAKQPDWQACELWGKQLVAGNIVAKDVATGRALLESACTHGAGGACRTIALREGERSPRYARLMEKSCDAGDVLISCVIVADLYAKGEHVKRDQAKANALYRRACDHGVSSACEKIK